MSSYVIDKLQPYKTHEQVMLLCSRNQLEEDESAYVQKLLKQQDMDWASFLGLILYHRVNGVVYRKLRGMNGIPWCREPNYISRKYGGLTRCYMRTVFAMPL